MTRSTDSEWYAVAWCTFPLEARERTRRDSDSARRRVGATSRHRRRRPKP